MVWFAHCRAGAVARPEDVCGPKGRFITSAVFDPPKSPYFPYRLKNEIKTDIFINRPLGANHTMVWAGRH